MNKLPDIRASQVLHSSRTELITPSTHLTFIFESICWPSSGIFLCVSPFVVTLADVRIQCSRPETTPSVFFFVSALGVSVPPTVQLGIFAIVEYDPIDLGLLMIGSNTDVDIVLATNVTVAATIEVYIVVLR